MYMANDWPVSDPFLYDRRILRLAESGSREKLWHQYQMTDQDAPDKGKIAETPDGGYRLTSRGRRMLRTLDAWENVLRANRRHGIRKEQFTQMMTGVSDGR